MYTYAKVHRKRRSSIKKMSLNEVVTLDYEMTKIKFGASIKDV